MEKMLSQAYFLPIYCFASSKIPSGAFRKKIYEMRNTPWIILENE
jgi:hypothetical protein